VTVHDVEMWRMPARGRLRQLGLRAYGAPLAHMLRSCAAVIAISGTSAQEAVETLALDPQRVHVVAHGVAGIFTAESTAADELVLNELGLTPGGYILWTGSLRHRDPRKDLDTLVASVAQLGSGAPPLALAGAGGSEARRLQTVAERLGARLVLCGRRKDAQLAALYRHAGVVALASTHEGFGFSALEAMASGTPVVGTSVGNLPELTTGAALLAPPGDPAALAGALRAVLSDGVRAAGMREAGLRRARDFTWEKAAAATADVYDAVAVSSSRAGTRTSRSG
jgi:glycosyltransferase involved in cell wall biosynthesis